MGMTGGRDGVTDGLVGALFPRGVVPQPPPQTEVVELLDAPDVEAWAIEHEVTCDGHECDDLLLRYRDETKPAVFCPQCRLLVSAREWQTPVPAETLAEPTHLATALFVLRANIGTGALLGVMTWLASLGFTTPGVAFLIAAVALAVYAGVTRER
jgi:hypothetical protein